MLDTPAASAPVPPRSTFVTVLAWLGILFFGFGLLVSAMQNIMVRTVFRDPRLGPVMADSLSNAPFPPEARWMFGHMQTFVLLIFCWVLLGFTASIGLLKRRNWARLTMITMLCLAIAWQLFSILLGRHMFTAISQPPFPQTDAMPDMAAMFRAMQVFIVGLTLAVTALCVWLISRLVSRDIRAEFDPGTA